MLLSHTTSKYQPANLKRKPVVHVAVDKPPNPRPNATANPFKATDPTWVVNYACGAFSIRAIEPYEGMAEEVTCVQCRRVADRSQMP